MAIRLQFSIRSLLLLTLLVSLPLGYEAYCQAKYRREWKLLRAINAMGGTVGANFSREQVYIDASGERFSIPRGFVTHVYLGKSRVTDANLRLLGIITTLEAFDLSETKISDQGLAHLTQLKKLKRLDLRHTKVTEAGAAELQQALPNCQILR